MKACVTSEVRLPTANVTSSFESVFRGRVEVLIADRRAVQVAPFGAGFLHLAERPNFVDLDVTQTEVGE